MSGAGPGIRWAGPLLDASGYATEGRALVRGLVGAGAGVSFGLSAPAGGMVLGRAEIERLADLATTHLDRIDASVQHGAASGFDPYAPGRVRVGRTMFETAAPPPAWMARLGQMDLLWVPSTHNRDALIDAGVDPERVAVVPSPIELARLDPDTPPRPMADVHGTVVLAVFEWSRRKGWDVLLDAWCRAFSADDDVTLVIKATPGGRARTLEEVSAQAAEHLVGLGHDPARIPDLVLLADTLGEREMAGLYAACHALVLPSRGEGWGRPAVEAMAMGRPAIATAWSGPVDYLDERVGWPIPARVVPVDPAAAAESPAYAGHHWAEPDVDALAAALRAVHDDPVEAARRGAAARARVARYDHHKVARDALATLADATPRRRPPPTPGRIPVVLSGPLFGLGSLALVNRELATGLMDSPRVDLGLMTDETVRPGPGDPVGRALMPALEGVVPGPAVTLRHGYPPRMHRARDGAVAAYLPWEYGALPEPWVAAARDLDEVWCYSAHVRDGAVASGLDPERVAVVPLGVDPARFRPGVAPLALGDAAPGFRFLFVGGLIWRKGVDLLLDAYASAFTRADDVTLVIKSYGPGGPYGGEPERERVERMARDPRGPRVVHLTGALGGADVPALYAACDCLVHPARAEGFGLTVLEAMACGLPVIVPDRGATADVATKERAHHVPARPLDAAPEAEGMRLAGAPALSEIDVPALAEAMRAHAADPADARARTARTAAAVRAEHTLGTLGRGRHGPHGRPGRSRPVRHEDLKHRRRRPIGGAPRHRSTGGSMGLKIVSGLSRPEPRISLCMIVRDEEDNLGRCLRSVDGMVDEIVVVDTGSIDGTVAIAERHGARVLHEEWAGDFAAPRNVALDAADGDWILVLDADEEVMGAEHLRTLVADAEDLEGFYLREVSYVGEKAGVEAVVHGALRLFRNRPHHRFDGALHEQISSKIEGELGERTRFVGSPEILHYGYLANAVRDRAKTERNRAIALQEALERPKDAFALFNAGIEYQRIDDHTRAVYFFQQSFSSLPDLRRNWTPVLLRALAASLRQLGKHDEALEVIADAETAFADFSDLYFLEAQIHSDRQEYRAAILALERALAIGDHDGDRYMARIGMGSFHSWFGLGVLMERVGDLGEAVRAFRKAVVSAGGCFPDAQAALVRLCLTTDPPEVVRDFVVGLLPARQRADSLRVVAEEFARADHPQHALELIDEALAAAPDDHGAQIARANALLMLGRLDDATAQLDAVPATSDLAGVADERRYLCALIEGDRDAAERAIVALADVDDGLTSFVLASVLGAVRGDDAPPPLPARLDAGDATTAALGLADQLLRLGRLDEFNAAERVVHALSPAPGEAHETLGTVLFDAGFPGPAAARLITAVEAGAASAGALAKLGHLCIDQDLPEDAEEFFRAALDADTENQIRYVDLVRLLAAAGRFQEAREVLSRGLEVYPHSTVMSELRDSFLLLAEALE